MGHIKRISNGNEPDWLFHALCVTAPPSVRQQFGPVLKRHKYNTS